MFLNIRADDSDNGDRSPWGNFWFEPVPMRGGVGVGASDQALQLTAVYACVRVLAEGVATLPFCLYKEGADGSKTLVKNHWLHTLFARRPNAYQNPLEFREMLQGHLALRGNGFARIVSNRQGVVTDLLPLHPDRTVIEMLSDTNWRYRYRQLDGTDVVLTRGEVFHLRGLSGNGILGYNPIQEARKAVTMGIAAQDYGMRFFMNDARPPGWIEYPGQFKDDEQRRLFRERYQRTQTGANRHKVAVFEMGMKFHEVKVSNDDAQYIETRKFSIAEIARLFRVPPHMIGDLEKATFSNIEQQSLEYVMHTLRPWLVRWEEAIRYTFLEEDSDLNIEFPVTALLRGDAEARSMYYHNGILDGWMTRNEARLMESLNPLEGLDEPLRPLNMVEEDEAENDDDGDEGGNALPPQNDGGDGSGEPSNNEQPNARLLALATAAAERVARKEAMSVHSAYCKDDPQAALNDFFAKHADFISGALSVPVAAALEYCIEQRALLDSTGGQIDAETYEATATLKLAQLAMRGTK